MIQSTVIQIYGYNQLRNFSYILHNEKKDITICIDPYDPEQIIQILENQKLYLTHIINTHEHFDHTKGNQKLIQVYSPSVYGHPQNRNSIFGMNSVLLENDTILLEADERLKVLDSPGHTLSHISLVLEKKDSSYCIFSGDTLFQAGVGNCKNNGNPKILYQTIDKFLSILENETIVYPGHNYIKHNLSFTLNIDKENTEAKNLLNSILNSKDEIKIVSTHFGLEKKINLFLKCILEPENISKSLQKKFETQENLFCYIRQLRDNF